MLFLSIYEIQYASQTLQDCDAVEFRLDRMDPKELPRALCLLQQRDYPFLFTWGKKLQQDIEPLLEKLFTLNPHFFDLCMEAPKRLLEKLFSSKSPTKKILSYHNFQSTPANLSAIYEKMREYPAFCYKMALRAHSTLDAFKLLNFAKKHPKVAPIVMGKAFSFARVLALTLKSPLNFIAPHAKKKTAPGQLTSSSLKIYGPKRLSPQTAIYGLIGAPVYQSMGHLYHNRLFQKRNLNAVYVKMRLKAEELASFFSLAKEFGIAGLSVTSPLKEKVIPFVDCFEKNSSDIGAINTLAFRGDKIYGLNTDGVAALDVIEKRTSIRGKKVAIFGAGGAARAIAFEAIQRGASITLINRTEEKARALAQVLGAKFQPLEEKVDADIAIHCSSKNLLLQKELLFPNTLVMDIVYHPKKTLFLSLAEKRGCRVIYGKEMFFAQANKQIDFWFTGTYPNKNISSLI